MPVRSKASNFDAAVKVAQLRLSTAGLDRGQLLALYQAFVARFVSDNSNIWTADSIFIPASFAAPAVYFSIQTSSLWQIAALFLASASLAFASLVIAEKHKQFQEQSMVEIRAIENLVASTALGNYKISPVGVFAIVGTSVRIAAVRRLLLGLLLCVWLIAGLDYFA